MSALIQYRLLCRPNSSLPHVRLIDAIYKHDLEKAKQALDDGADPNYVDHRGHYLIFIAFACDENILNLLIDRPSTNIFVTDGDGNSLLHRLANYGMNGTIIHLIDKGLNINLLNNYNKSPIWYAIEHGHLDTTQLLLDRGAVVNDNVIKKYIVSVLYPSGLEFFKLLLDHYQLGQPNYVKLLKAAVTSNNLMVFNYLNEHYPDHVRNAVNIRLKHNCSLLHHVDNVTIDRTLLSYGANINAVDNDGETPIFYLDDDSLELAQLYIDHQIDLTIKNKIVQTCYQASLDHRDYKLAALIKNHPAI